MSHIKSDLTFFFSLWSFSDDEVKFRHIKVQMRDDHTPTYRFTDLRSWAIRLHLGDSSSSRLPFNLAQYSVSFDYTDTDGDEVMIILDSCIEDAINQFKEEGSVKVFANVRDIGGMDTLHRVEQRATMESLFAPTNRFRDLYRARERDDDEDDDEEYNDQRMNDLVELELVTGSSLEDTFLHCGLTWSDYYSFARGKMVWLSPDVFFDSYGIGTNFQTDYREFLTVIIAPNEEDTSQASKFVHVCARSEAHATVASDILLQLLTTCESRKVDLRGGLQGGDISDCFPVSGLAFSHFLAQSRNLRVLCVYGFELDTSHCRAIDALTRTDLQIELFGCKVTESGENILLECIRQNRGPTKLFWCRIDTRRLADTLRGNNSVTTLAPRGLCSDEERLVLVQALAENEGIVKLDLNTAPTTDEIWIALWRSVAHHPKLEKLGLPQYRSTWRDGNTDAQKTLRMQVMVDALRINTVLHTVELHRVDFDEEILDSTVYPLLLANRYRPRVRAITEVEGLLRPKLLGRALGSISSNPSLIWMFLSGNANVRVGTVTAQAKESA
jgi:hypothetical protein